jgi:hypothetical protein
MPLRAEGGAGSLHSLTAEHRLPLRSAQMKISWLPGNECDTPTKKTVTSLMPPRHASLPRRSLNDIANR